MRRALALFGLLALLVAGCGGSTAATGSVPGSASLAPADSLAYVTLVTDEGSSQWQKADRLLSLFPGARESLVGAVERALSDEELTWEGDVAPALGPEVVVVVLASQQPIVLTKPDSEAKLSALLGTAGEQSVHTRVADGWTAIAEEQSHLAAYTEAVGRGTLERDAGFVSSFEGLPEEALARAWVDAAALSRDVQSLVEGAGSELDLGLDSLSAAVSTEDDGIFLGVVFEGPEGTGTTSYEPKLFGRVPGDAVAALSFGGTQGALDRIQSSVDVDAISGQLEDLLGISLDGIVDALSGEGVLYVRDGGGSIPEVTLVLAPPDPDDTYAMLEKLGARVADEGGGEVSTTTEDGLAVTVIAMGDLSLRYARLDSETVIVTTGTTAIRTFRGDDEKLVDTSAFESAATRVELGDRTRGFVYVDIDGLVPFVEGLVGADAVPSDAREILGNLDSVILQTEGDGDITRATGFVRVTGA